MGPGERRTAALGPRCRPPSAARIFDDVARELGADGIALFIVSTENRPRGDDRRSGSRRIETRCWSRRRREKQDMPHYTLYLAELARRVGGQLYFLREIGNLNEIYRRIALAISAQYTLGYYPSAGTARPGWRSLRVEFINNSKNSDADAKIPPGVRLTNRDSYYVSSFQ